MASRARHDLSADAWLRQAKRDLRAAEHLLAGGFYPHATVIAHLAVEKALKGLYRARLDRHPPVTHDLQYLAERTALTVPADLREALDLLRNESILRLYPDRAFEDAPDYGCEHARERVTAAHALLNWISDHV